MAVKVHIHPAHLQFTKGLEVVPLAGATVGECLEELIREFPEMEQALFSRKGRLLKSVEVYINQDSAYPDELAKPLKDGDSVHLLLMLAGG